MEKVKWIINIGWDTPPVYKERHPICANWFSREFKDFFIKNLERKLNQHNMEILNLSMKISCLYSPQTIKPSKLTKQILDYELVAILSKKNSNKQVKIVIYSNTINLARLNKYEKIKYLCGLTSILINNIATLGKLGFNLNSKLPPEIKISSYKYKTSEEIGLLIKTDHLEMIIKNSKNINRDSSVTLYIDTGKSKKFLPKVINYTIDNVLDAIKLINIDEIEPLHIISMSLSLSPEDIINKIEKALQGLKESIRIGAFEPPKRGTLCISLYGKNEYQKDNTGKYVWNDKLIVKVNTKLTKKIFPDQMVKKDKYYKGTVTVFSI